MPDLKVQCVEFKGTSRTYLNILGNNGIKYIQKDVLINLLYNQLKITIIMTLLP